MGAQEVYGVNPPEAYRVRPLARSRGRRGDTFQPLIPPVLTRSRHALALLTCALTISACASEPDALASSPEADALPEAAHADEGGLLASMIRFQRYFEKAAAAG